MTFIRENETWWELDAENGIAYNYMGGHHTINKEIISKSFIFECNSWHELYLLKNFCPLETDKQERTAWLSPDGKFYEAQAHEVAAEYLCDIIYGIEPQWPSDELEKRGWVRITTSLMWEVRFEEWKSKKLTQKQLDSLWDWCKFHDMKYPYQKGD